MDVVSQAAVDLAASDTLGKTQSHKPQAPLTTPGYVGTLIRTVRSTDGMYHFFSLYAIRGCDHTGFVEISIT
jgi:hypothetical protein